MSTLLAALLCTSLAHAEAERKLALLVSNHEGFDGTVPLRFVTEDVRKTREVLERQGGYHRLDVYEVDRATPAYLAQKVKELGYRIRALQDRGVRVSLFVYYSGHADAAELQLGRQGLPWEELKAWLEAAGADTNLLVIDACGAGGAFGAKGLEKVPGPLPELAPGLADEDFAIVTAAAADQSARESRELQSSLFTHFYTHGQWGDADADHDGLVTLRESFDYASGWVATWAQRNRLGPQDPQLRAQDPELVLADLTTGTEAGLVLAPGAGESFRVYDARTGALVLPVDVGPDGATLALGPGRYLVHREAAYGAARADVTLVAGQTATLHADDFELAWDEDVLKGWRVTARQRVALLDVSVRATGGLVTWTDPDVHRGYFPSAGAGGTEVRVAWPSGLYWSADAWGGLGSGQVQTQAEGAWETQAFRTWEIRAGGLGVAAGASTHGRVIRVSGALHVEGYTLDRRLSDGTWSAGDDDPATAPIGILAPGLAAGVGLHDGHAELDLTVRSHYLPYILEPGGTRRDNVGTTQAFLSLGWRL